MRRAVLLCLILSIVCPYACAGAGVKKTSIVYRSHPPLRRAPAPANRPMADGPAFFADALQGDDTNVGTKTAPWKTVQHALTRLRAGDTLYLRGGPYRENLHIRLRGAKNRPITIRSYPGEQAILDGALAEFFSHPQKTWRPFAGGAANEFRSVKPYPNLRNIVASFGDSMIGLHSYYHAMDLRSDRETVEPDPKAGDVKPLYCGPGLWYDHKTGYIHARFRHTNLPGADNYRGETDPRKLPLVIAPFRSAPLRVDGAEHVRFQDLVIRGGGYDTVVLEQCSDIEFDNVTVWCGTYGLRATGARRLKFHRSALHGGIAPWTTRFESGFNTYPGRKTRNITRLNTHALLVAAANPEFSVYHFPFNDDWEISYCEFTEAADGLYLGGVSMRFHHNLVHNMHDDGIYLSPMYQRHKIFGGGATLHIYQNFFSRCLTMLAFGGTELNHDKVFFYRNIVDMRVPIQTGRPTQKSPKMSARAGKLTGDHGSPPWSAMNAYHNTFVVGDRANTADMWMARGAVEDRPRKVFNNIFLHMGGLAPLRLLDNSHLQIDGNLYWQPGLDAKKAAAFFSKYRASVAFQKSKKNYHPGFESHSAAADPKFVKAAMDATVTNDYRLKSGSPAIDRGVDIPSDWPDPLRQLDKGRPDIGALPLGVKRFQAGRGAPRLRKD